MAEGSEPWSGGWLLLPRLNQFCRRPSEETAERSTALRLQCPSIPVWGLAIAMK